MNGFEALQAMGEGKYVKDTDGYVLKMNALGEVLVFSDLLSQWMRTEIALNNFLRNKHELCQRPRRRRNEAE